MDWECSLVTCGIASSTFYNFAGSVRFLIYMRPISNGHWQQPTKINIVLTTIIPSYNRYPLGTFCLLKVLNDHSISEKMIKDSYIVTSTRLVQLYLPSSSEGQINKYAH
jgi:hypothetical protein